VSLEKDMLSSPTGNCCSCQPPWAAALPSSAGA